MKRLTHGFTLIELAIALAIVGLLLGGLSVPLSKRIAEQQYAQTQTTIDRAVEALLGYALLNQRLPCPDIATSVTDNRDGMEDAMEDATEPVITCAVGANTGAFDFTFSSDGNGASWGDLPWKTLGLSPPYDSDAWNNRLRYAVVTDFALPVAAKPLKTNLHIPKNTLMIHCGNLAKTTLATAAPGCAGPTYLVSKDAAFVVYSSGSNGRNATNIGIDEAINAPEKKKGTSPSATTLRKQFVTRDRTDSSSHSGEFDDLLSYMPRAKLAARLTNAGLYP